MPRKILYHNYLFLFGYIYYLCVPLVVYSQRILADYPGMDYIYEYFKNDYIPTYLLCIVLLFISFYTGSFLPLGYIKKSSKQFITSSISSRDLFLLALPFFIYGQYVILQNIHSLFQGYLVDYNISFMGTISTLNTLFLFFLIYNKEKTFQGNSFINLFFAFALIEFSIILLGVGSRMYILIPCIAYIIYCLDKKLLSLKKMFLGGSMVILFFLIIGIWRLGNNNFSLDMLLYIGIAEPAFTWISASSMFSLNHLPILAFPHNFLSSFYNFIPTILFPNKGEYISPIALEFENPLGATNILVSLFSNFGILGSCLVFFLLGFLLTYLRYKFKNTFNRTYYYCICGIIPFQLFRDDFAIVNKMIFYNFLIFPCILLFIGKILYKISLKTP